MFLEYVIIYVFVASLDVNVYLNDLNTRNVYDKQFLYGYECLKSISAIFQLYCGGLFCYWNKMKYMTKTKMLANPFP
jgi:hypothetical protein